MFSSNTMIVQPSILRKALAAFSAIAIVSQAVFAPFADAAYFTLYQLSIKYNGTTYSGSFGATPGSTLEILAAGMNEDETATNVAMNFTFSSTDITYVNPGTVDIYNGETLIRSDVSTLDFNPPNDNSIPLAATSETYDYFQVYYVGIGIPSDFSDYTFTVSSQISADWFAGSNTLSQTVYVNVRPHVTDYYFEKSSDNSVTTQVSGAGAESFNFVAKVKDYNGCTNIDGGTVTANLSQLGLSSTESLSYESCAGDGLTAIFKKTGLTTVASVGSYSFDNSHITATDEDGNVDTPSDSNTTFDDEDKKTTLSLTVAAPAAPNVSIASVSDSVIGGSTNPTSTVTFSGSQDGTVKVAIGSDGSCVGGTIVQDWTASGSYVANTSTGYTINASNLSEWSNTIYVCVKSTAGTIGSANTAITKDTSAPTLSSISMSPGNVTTGNATAWFRCSENGTYRVEIAGSGTPWSGTLEATGATTANASINATVLNAHMSDGSNAVQLYCFDDAENVGSGSTSVTKTTPPPSMVGKVTGLSDGDSDYNGLDGRDLLVAWDNTDAAAYSAFESYRIYILPSSTTLDTNSHTPLAIYSPSSTSSWSGSSSITKDSTNTTLVSGGSYKACIAIMSTPGILGTAWCSANATLTGDTVQNPTVLSAKFTSDTNLQITTDATLDTTLSTHTATGITYTVEGVSKTATAVASVNGTKINLTIPALSNLAATGTTLAVATGSLHASGGGYNNAFSSGSLIITDGQTPTITAFSTGTVSSYGGYYSGSLAFNYTFAEAMKTDGTTRYVFTRTAGSADAGSPRYSTITSAANASSWAKTMTVSLTGASLVSGATYSVYISATDNGNNTAASSTITGIKFDNTGPAAATQTPKTLESTLSPTFAWSAASDDSGNGSGVKYYSLSVYSGTGCQWAAIRTQTGASTSIALSSALPADTAAYSWKVAATDNMDNTGTASACDDFEVNTAVPALSDARVTDTTISSTGYAKSGDAITVSAAITQSDASHIWLNISALSGSGSLTAVSCAAPPTGVTCSYSSSVATYSFVAGFGGSVSDGVRQAQFTATNTSGGGTGTIIASTTMDSTAPTASSPFTAPTSSSVWGGTEKTITWNTSSVADAGGLASVELAYSTGDHTSWTVIGTGSNAGSMSWNISALSSGADYQLRMIVRDNAKNSTTALSDIFSIDKTGPNVPNNTLTYPNGATILKGATATTITWDAGSITDAGGLATDPIKLEYSLDNGSTWATIAASTANDGSESWTTPSANTTNVLVRLTATDSAGNISTDTSDTTSIIDSTVPALTLTYAGAGGTTPQNGRYINTSGIDVSGAGADTYLANVSYTLQNLSSNQYWNSAESDFSSASAVWNTICADSTTLGTDLSCGSLSSTIALANITDGTTYRLIIRAIDEAGNSTTANAIDYIGDVTAPAVAISTADGGYLNSSISISGTASDGGSGGASVKIEITKWWQWWDGSAWVGSSQLLATSGTFASWSYSFSPPSSDADGQAYSIIAHAYDNAFKTANTSTTSISLVHDTSGPIVASDVFTFATGSIYLGTQTMSVTWDPSKISSTGASLSSTPIEIRANFGTGVVTIASSTENDGSYDFTLPSVDTATAFLMLRAYDSIATVSNNVLSNSFAIDSTPPSISSASTMDRDADGQIDAISITMSEPIIDSTLNVADFSIGAGIGIPSSIDTVTTPNDTTFELRFTNTGSTATTPSITYTQGSLADPSGRKLATTAITPDDDAVPRLVSVSIFDDDTNGVFDRMAVRFSEAMASTSTLAGWTLSNEPSNMSISSVSVSGDTINLALSGDTIDTGTGSLAITLASSIYQDLTGNASGNFSNQAVSDAAAPIIISANTRDSDSNGKIDALYITLSESVPDSSVSASDFSVNGYNPLQFSANFSGDASNDRYFYLRLTETGATTDTNAAPQIVYTAGGLEDGRGNHLASRTMNASDGVAPKLLSRETADGDGDGRVDRIILSYSEALGSDTSWLSVSVANYSVDSYTTSGTGLFVNLTEKPLADSSVTPDVRVVSNSTLEDSVWNTVPNETTASPATDRVGPVIIGARYDEKSGGVSDDVIIVTFSEAIDAATINTSNAATDFVLSSGGSLGSNSSVAITSSTTAEITLNGAGVSAATIGTSKLSLATAALSDTSGNTSPTESSANRVTLSASVVINEIMWSQTGSSASQYIELRNLSSSSVSLNGWSIENAWGNGVNLSLPSASIPANGYYLITKTAVTSGGNLLKDNDVTAAHTDMTLALSSSNPDLILKNASDVEVDRATVAFDPLIGNADSPASMERRPYPGDGTDSSDWYTGQARTLFDTGTPQGTPGAENVYDVVLPSITTSLSDGTLFAHGTLVLRYAYTDTGWISSTPPTTLELENNDGAGNYSAASGSPIAWSGATGTGATYQLANLSAGLYRVTFSVSDEAGNTSEDVRVFYVDNFSMTIDTNTLSFGSLANGSISETAEATVTIRTVGAGYSLSLSGASMDGPTGGIGSWNGSTWFGYDRAESWSGGTTAYGGTPLVVPNASIASRPVSADTNGNLKTYIYTIKYLANPTAIQGAGQYSVETGLSINVSYE